MKKQKVGLSIVLLAFSMLVGGVSRAGFFKQEIEFNLEYQDGGFGIKKQTGKVKGSLTLKEHDKFCQLTLGTAKALIPCKSEAVNVCVDYKENDCVHSKSTIKVDSQALLHAFELGKTEVGFYTKRTFEIVKERLAEGNCEIPAGSSFGLCYKRSKDYTFTLHGAWFNFGNTEHLRKPTGTVTYELNSKDSSAEIVKLMLTTTNVVEWP